MKVESDSRYGPFYEDYSALNEALRLYLIMLCKGKMLLAAHFYQEIVESGIMN